jgi:hypothetical protein
VNEHKCMLRKNRQSKAKPGKRAWSINCPLCGEVSYPEWVGNYGFTNHTVAAQIAWDHVWVAEWLPRMQTAPVE